MPPVLTHTQLVRSLARRLRGMERSRRGRVPGDEPVGSSGIESLDRLLPAGGFERGTLVEWLSGVGEGSGSASLALTSAVARTAEVGSGVLVVVDPAGEFYPPAAVALGVGLSQVLLIRPRGSRERDWAIEQVLRSRAVEAVVAWIDRLDDRRFRRLQLAAERGGGVGHLLRPAGARWERSWAAVRLEVLPRPSGEATGSRRLAVRRIGGTAAVGDPDEGRPREVLLELCDETGRVHPLAELADPAPLRRAVEG